MFSILKSLFTCAILTCTFLQQSTRRLIKQGLCVPACNTTDNDVHAVFLILFKKDFLQLNRTVTTEKLSICVIKILKYKLKIFKVLKS